MSPLKLGVLTALIPFCVASLAQTAPDVQRTLELDQAIALAVQEDPWFDASEQMQRADLLKEAAVEARPSPSVSLSMLNLPTDTFSVRQEPMTQLRVGVTQAFARGDTVELTREQQRLKANRHPVEREDRAARVALAVTRHWLDVAQAKQHQALVREDIATVEQLVDTTSSAYESGVGKVRQQDVLDARLELAKMQEQLSGIIQREEQARASLLTLLGEMGNALSIAPVIPPIPLPDVALEQRPDSRQRLAEHLAMHPSVRVLAVDHTVASQAVEIAKQKKAPQWAVNGGYAYRSDARSGDSRADFLSVGVSVDIPLFNDTANDNAVQAAFAESEAVETRRRALIRDLLTQVNALRAALTHLYERQQQYHTKILPQSEDYAEATLDAYTAAQGSVETVLDARAAHLQARIAALNIDTDIARHRATLAYYTTTAMTQEK